MNAASLVAERFGQVVATERRCQVGSCTAPATVEVTNVDAVLEGGVQRVCDEHAAAVLWVWAAQPVLLRVRRL